MANLQRNEVTITLGRTKHVMRASFEAISAIEGELGSILHLSDRFARSELGMRDMATIVFHGLRGREGYDRPAPLGIPAIGEALVELGGVKAIGLTAEFLAIVMNGVTLGKPEKALAKS